MSADATLEFLTDPAEFLRVAGDHLALDPVVNTVVATVADRTIHGLADGLRPPKEDWWMVVRDATGAVVGAGMRTAPFEPRPPYLLPMPDQAARQLARVLHARGEPVTSINGALPAVHICAEETALLTGGAARVAIHMRLFELGELVVPAPVSGHLRVATDDDVGLAVEWFDAFIADADEQAGRPIGSGLQDTTTADDMLRRIRAGRIWFWVDQDGAPVHLSATSPPSFGVARIGPVYTPRHARARGFASAAVAELSRRIVADGARACLFTDQANPTSNRIYQALGYRPVVDMANVVIG